MYVPIIRTRTTNVELTNAQRATIIKKLTPLGRYLPADEQAEIDVALRFERHRFGGSKYYVSVKLATSTDTYYAVAIESRMEKALSKTRDILKRVLTKSTAKQQYTFRNQRMHIIDHYRLLLGNH